MALVRTRVCGRAKIKRTRLFNVPDVGVDPLGNRFAVTTIRPASTTRCNHLNAGDVGGGAVAVTPFLLVQF